MPTAEGISGRRWQRGNLNRRLISLGRGVAPEAVGLVLWWWRNLHARGTLLLLLLKLLILLLVLLLEGLETTRCHRLFSVHVS